MATLDIKQADFESIRVNLQNNRSICYHAFDFGFLKSFRVRVFILVLNTN